jgi:hypothetical protein
LNTKKDDSIFRSKHALILRSGHIVRSEKPFKYDTLSQSNLKHTSPLVHIEDIGFVKDFAVDISIVDCSFVQERDIFRF